MITELQSATHKAVSLMGQSQKQARINVESAEQQLQTIDEASGTISEMAIQIASAVEEQNAVTTEISSNTEQIKILADSLTDQAGETGNRAADLRQVANSLHQLSDRFKV